jgi:hypothetical protein
MSRGEGAEPTQAFGVGQAICREAARFDVMLPSPLGVADVAGEEHGTIGRPHHIRRAAGRVTRHPKCPHAAVPKHVEDSREATAWIGGELPLVDRRMAFELPIDVGLHEHVDERARGRFAGACIDRRALRNVRHPRHVVQVQVRQEHASDWRRLPRKESGSVGLHVDLVAVHDTRHDAPNCRVVGVIPKGVLDARVHEDGATLRVAQDVEVDLYGLGPVFEVRRLGRGMVEVDEAASVDLPIGGHHRIEDHGPRLVEVDLHVRARPDDAEVGGSDTVSRSSAAG